MLIYEFMKCQFISQISIKKINIIFNVPPVALENNDLDCMTNLKMYSKDLKHF